MEFIYQNNAVLTIIFSVALFIIPIFTQTRKENEKSKLKKLTKWGWLYISVFLLSQIIIYSYTKDKKQRNKIAKEIRRYKEDSIKTELQLIRLISLLDATSNIDSIVTNVSELNKKLSQDNNDLRKEINNLIEKQREYQFGVPEWFTYNIDLSFYIDDPKIIEHLRKEEKWNSYMTQTNSLRWYYNNLNVIQTSLEFHTSNYNDSLKIIAPSFELKSKIQIDSSSNWLNVANNGLLYSDISSLAYMDTKSKSFKISLKNIPINSINNNGGILSINELCYSEMSITVLLSSSSETRNTIFKIPKSPLILEKFEIKTSKGNVMRPKNFKNAIRPNPFTWKIKLNKENCWVYI